MPADLNAKECSSYDVEYASIWACIFLDDELLDVQLKMRKMYFTNHNIMPLTVKLVILPLRMCLKFVKYKMYIFYALWY